MGNINAVPCSVKVHNQGHKLTSDGLDVYANGAKKARAKGP